MGRADGNHRQIVTHHPVRYDKNPSPDYDEIDIRNCDERIKVQIVE